MPCLLCCSGMAKLVESRQLEDIVEEDVEETDNSEVFVASCRQREVLIQDSSEDVWLSMFYIIRIFIQIELAPNLDQYIQLNRCKVDVAPFPLSTVILFVQQTLIAPMGTVLLLFEIKKAFTSTFPVHNQQLSNPPLPDFYSSIQIHKVIALNNKQNTILVQAVGNYA